MLSLKSLSSIPGIGKSINEQLKTLNINSIQDLQNVNMEKLRNTFGNERANFLWNLSFGKDSSPVKSSGKPNSIGLEDACKPLSLEVEIQVINILFQYLFKINI